MPVLTVSLKTCPQVGFSRKRWTRPSSSRIVMPNSRGSAHPGQADRHQRADAPRWWRDQPGQVDVGERVTADDEERVVAQRGFAFLTLPAVPERLVLGGVGQRHPELFAVAEVVADEGGEELDRHDGLGESVPPEQPQDVPHDRAVDHRQQRLRRASGHRPQSGALAAGHDHGLHRPTHPRSIVMPMRLDGGCQGSSTDAPERRTCHRYPMPAHQYRRSPRSATPSRRRAPRPRTVGRRSPSRSPETPPAGYAVAALPRKWTGRPV